MSLHFSLQRQSLLRKDAKSLQALANSPHARVIGVFQGNPSIATKNHFVPFTALNAAQRTQAIFLGVFEEAPTFALTVFTQDSLFPDAAFGDIRQLAHTLGTTDLSIAIQAKALCYWHEKHPYCAVCGHHTEMADAGYRRQCSHCGAEHFPRCDPAVIVGVTHENKILLGRQASWPAQRFSVIAGFAEPGESLEQAVVREVWEETGVLVKSVQYLNSQPWPYPSSLMLAFTAEAGTTDISLNDKELEQAFWISRSAFADQVKAKELLPPPRASIAYGIVKAWYEKEGLVMSELFKT